MRIFGGEIACLKKCWGNGTTRHPPLNLCKIIGLKAMCIVWSQRKNVAGLASRRARSTSRYGMEWMQKADIRANSASSQGREFKLNLISLDVR